ncbi:hypothetical protein G6F70_005186 [Rhizopus microsporus]|nr:hypothetical protein G6F71_007465 [Rhizopus microsporus]KAG1199138.1 hypothetical protein G6F70_005186 [Rhizopus microsporus]KAG1210965.1 hypothetical protein G6F69_005005 [Rhizopus microsporus]
MNKPKSPTPSQWSQEQTRPVPSRSTNESSQHIDRPMPAHTLPIPQVNHVKQQQHIPHQYPVHPELMPPLQLSGAFAAAQHLYATQYYNRSHNNPYSVPPFLAMFPSHPHFFMLNDMNIQSQQISSQQPHQGQPIPLQQQQQQQQQQLSHINNYFGGQNANFISRSSLPPPFVMEPKEYYNEAVPSRPLEMIINFNSSNIPAPTYESERKIDNTKKPRVRRTQKNNNNTEQQQNLPGVATIIFEHSPLSAKENSNQKTRKLRSKKTVDAQMESTEQQTIEAATPEIAQAKPQRRRGQVAKENNENTPTLDLNDANVPDLATEQIPTRKRRNTRAKNQQTIAHASLAKECSVNDNTMESTSAIEQQPMMPIAIPKESSVENSAVDKPIATDDISEKLEQVSLLLKEPVVGEPVVEQHVIDEPILEECVANECVMERSMVEEPAIGTSIAEETNLKEIISEKSVNEHAIEDQVVNKKQEIKALEEEALMEKEVTAENPSVEYDITKEEPVIGQHAEKATIIDHLENSTSAVKVSEAVKTVDSAATNAENVLPNANVILNEPKSMSNDIKELTVKDVQEQPTLDHSIESEKEIDTSEEASHTTEAICHATDVPKYPTEQVEIKASKRMVDESLFKTETMLSDEIPMSSINEKSEANVENLDEAVEMKNTQNILSNDTDRQPGEDFVVEEEPKDNLTKEEEVEDKENKDEADEKNDSKTKDLADVENKEDEQEVQIQAEGFLFEKIDKQNVDTNNEKPTETTKNEESFIPNSLTEQRTCDDHTDAESVTTSVRMDRIQQEIETINAEFPELKNYYQLLDRAGRGTFSKVYKARDLLYENYMPWSLQKKVENAIDSDHHLVAIKLIYGISSPKRVANEISCLSELRGSPCIIPMITALRNQDVTYLVLPFIEFDHFEYVHQKGIIHRDVKPGNFLYNKTTKTGYLGDFGLAQRVVNYDIHKPGHQHATVDPIYTEHQNGPAGYFIHDKRKHIHVDRSGTRSFRAPEIYLHSMRQTTAMDIWAVGVILLSFLTNVYPFFDPEDSAAGIVELISVFGTKKVHEFAKFYGRNLKTNIPDMPEDAIGMDELCRYFNNSTIETWDKRDYLLAVDLMKNCLQLIDSKRLSAAEALKHPFLKEVMESKPYS